MFCLCSLFHIPTVFLSTIIVHIQFFALKPVQLSSFCYQRPVASKFITPETLDYQVVGSSAEGLSQASSKAEDVCWTQEDAAHNQRHFVSGINWQSWNGVSEVLKPWVDTLNICRDCRILMLCCYHWNDVIIWPPDLVGGLSFYRHSSVFNQNQPCVWKWVQFVNACPKFGASPLLKNWWPKTTFFDDCTTKW